MRLPKGREQHSGVLYNEGERFAWGPDDEKEFAEWWPEIETKEALLQ